MVFVFTAKSISFSSFVVFNVINPASCTSEHKRHDQDPTVLVDATVFAEDDEDLMCMRLLEHLADATILMEGNETHRGLGDEFLLL